MQELGKFNFKINVISIELKKYINNKLVFIGSFQLLSPSLDDIFITFFIKMISSI